MKKVWDFIKKHVAWVIIGILIAIIILIMMTKCSGPDGNQTPTTDTLTIHDTIPGDAYPDTVYVDRPTIVYRDVSHAIPLPVDTGAIIFNYFAENFYDIVLRDDTGAYIRYKTSVWLNQLQPGELIFQNRRPWHITNTTVVNNNIQERKFKCFLGLSVGGSANGFMLAPGVLFQYKSFLTGVNYDVIGNQVSIPLYWKLSFKKKKN